MGDRVFRMAARPGRLAEIMPAPRPDEPPDVMRKRPEFIRLCQELLRKLEEDEMDSGKPSA